MYNYNLHHIWLPYNLPIYQYIRLMSVNDSVCVIERLWVRPSLRYLTFLIFSFQKEPLV